KLFQNLFEKLRLFRTVNPLQEGDQVTEAPKLAFLEDYVPSRILRQMLPGNRIEKLNKGCDLVRVVTLKCKRSLSLYLPPSLLCVPECFEFEAVVVPSPISWI